MVFKGVVLCVGSDCGALCIVYLKAGGEGGLV